MDEHPYRQCPNCEGFKQTISYWIRQTNEANNEIATLKTQNVKTNVAKIILIFLAISFVCSLSAWIYGCAKRPEELPKCDEWVKVMSSSDVVHSCLNRGVIATEKLSGNDVLVRCVCQNPLQNKL